MDIIRDTDLGIDMMREVLDDALEQCFGGKGIERHGRGELFLDQPWHMLAKLHGEGFLTGQASKKLGEAASLKISGDFTAKQYERELLGAIVYCAMALVYGRLHDGGDEQLDLLDQPDWVTQHEEELGADAGPAPTIFQWVRGKC